MIGLEGVTEAGRAFGPARADNRMRIKPKLSRAQTYLTGVFHLTSSQGLGQSDQTAARPVGQRAKWLHPNAPLRRETWFAPFERWLKVAYGHSQQGANALVRRRFAPLWSTVFGFVEAGARAGSPLTSCTNTDHAFGQLMKIWAAQSCRLQEDAKLLTVDKTAG